MAASGHSYTVCSVAAAAGTVRLYHSGASGVPFGQFEVLESELARSGQRLEFAMNAGMYHASREPVGLYIEAGRMRTPLVTGSGQGNFYLKPNGVFYLAGNRAGVIETTAFVSAGVKADYATQSGPMLLVSGAIHPQFSQTSTSRHVRNGVGVGDGGRLVIFAISNEPVTLFEFASLFRDSLGARDALYLDGAVSRLYAPALGRADTGGPLGPIVAVLANAVAHAPAGNEGSRGRRR